MTGTHHLLSTPATGTPERCLLLPLAGRGTTCLVAVRANEGVSKMSDYEVNRAHRDRDGDLVKLYGSGGTSNTDVIQLIRVGHRFTCRSRKARRCMS